MDVVAMFNAVETLVLKVMRVLHQYSFFSLSHIWLQYSISGSKLVFVCLVDLELFVLRLNLC